MPRISSALCWAQRISARRASPKAISDPAGCPRRHWRTPKCETPASEKPICGAPDSKARCLESCKFPGATLTAACFNHSRIKLCDFSESDISDAQFVSAQIEGSRFHACNGPDANFSNGRMKACDFARADLARVRFSRRI